MNSLLPILVGLQNGPNAINDSGSTKEPVARVISDQANPSGYTFARAFSQIFREQDESSPLSKQLQAFDLTDNQYDATSQPSLAQQDFRSLELLVSQDVDEKVLSESRAYRIPTSRAASILPTLDSDALPDPAGLVSTKVLDASFVAMNGSISEQAQKFSFEQTPLPAAFPTIVPTPLKETQVLANGFLRSRAFQAIGGEPSLGQVRKDLEMNGNFSGRGQVSLPKVLESRRVFQQSALPKVPESGLVSQPVPQGSVKIHASLELKPEEGSFTRTIALSVKDVVSSVQHVGRLVPEAETLRTPIVQAFSNPLGRSQNVPLNPTSPVAAVLAEGPAGFTGPGQTNQIPLKSIQGNTLVLNTLTGQSHEQRTVVPADLPGDTGLLGKGERAQTIVETSIKSLVLDPSSGQGLGSGMNHSSNSQSGFQQPSSSPGPGAGLRALEERGQALPAPALQRLQMDVQLSESQRVQIDVGVQNRQVYAGLVMDHSVLRNLAAQFVPHLENQLAEVDLELQEFSAEVREEQENRMIHQQPSSSPGPGAGLRALEERGQALPAPALQRLQMDVQLSESQRVQIDVGVQNRQVYAGLVMDHSVLRNLAAQFVPHLENQLAEVDLELQEFSAEVREEQENHADTLFHDQNSQDPHESLGRSQGEIHAAQNSLNRYEEQGLHFVA